MFLGVDHKHHAVDRDTNRAVVASDALEDEAGPCEYEAVHLKFNETF